MTKITVKIIKETKKAKFVEDGEGRQAWIQNRSFKDGEVNLKTFEKSVASLIERIADTKEQKQYMDSNVDISDFIEGVTKSGKAEYLTLELWEEYTDQRVFKRVFLPISMKKVDGYPAWFLERKCEEIRSDLRQSYNGGCFVCENSHEVFNRVWG